MEFFTIWAATLAPYSIHPRIKGLPASYSIYRKTQMSCAKSTRMKNSIRPHPIRVSSSASSTQSFWPRASRCGVGSMSTIEISDPPASCPAGYIEEAAKYQRRAGSRLLPRIWIKSSTHPPHQPFRLQIRLEDCLHLANRQAKRLSSKMPTPRSALHG